MIEIRDGFFETNSSSCHVFIYHTNQNVSFPKVVTLTPNSYDNPLDILFNDYYGWFDYDSSGFASDICKFLGKLKKAGIKTVKCSDKRIVNLFNDAEPYGDISGMPYIISGDVKVDTMEDYLVDADKIKEDHGDDASYFAIRLS